MNTRRTLITMLTVAGLLASHTLAAEAHAAKAVPGDAAKALAAKPKATVAPLKEVTLTGNLSKQQMRIAGTVRTLFTLVAATGEKIHLPAAACAPKVDTPAIHLADFVGQSVKVVALAREQQKAGKTVVKIRTIKSIEKVAAATSAASSRRA